VAILRRKTYLIQPVIQLSMCDEGFLSPQGVAGEVRGEYKSLLLISLTNQLANCFGVWQKTFWYPHF